MIIMNVVRAVTAFRVLRVVEAIRFCDVLENYQDCQRMKSRGQPSVEGSRRIDTLSFPYLLFAGLFVATALVIACIDFYFCRSYSSRSGNLTSENQMIRSVSLSRSNRVMGCEVCCR